MHILYVDYVYVVHKSINDKIDESFHQHEAKTPHMAVPQQLSTAGSDVDLQVAPGCRV